MVRVRWSLGLQKVGGPKEWASIDAARTSFVRTDRVIERAKVRLRAQNAERFRQIGDMRAGCMTAFWRTNHDMSGLELSEWREAPSAKGWRLLGWVRTDQGQPVEKASWKQRKSKMSSVVLPSQSAAGSAAVKRSWKQRKSKMSSVVLPSQSA